MFCSYVDTTGYNKMVKCKFICNIVCVMFIMLRMSCTSFEAKSHQRWDVYNENVSTTTFFPDYYYLQCDKLLFIAVIVMMCVQIVVGIGVSWNETKNKRVENE